MRKKSTCSDSGAAATSRTGSHKDRKEQTDDVGDDNHVTDDDDDYDNKEADCHRHSGGWRNRAPSMVHAHHRSAHLCHLQHTTNAGADAEGRRSDFCATSTEKEKGKIYF